MSWLSNAFDKVKGVVSKVGSAVGKVASVALPVAGFAVGLVAPGLGATIGKVADKLGNKLSDITGIGDGKPGILGIGDGLPGILGIGTGKGKAKTIKQTAEAVLKVIDEKKAKGESLTPEEVSAKAQAEEDIKKDSGGGLIPWLVGGLGLLLALG